MNEYEFATAQLSFAHRLRRLIQLPVRIKGGNFSVDDIVRVIAGQVDGTEAVAGLVVSRIARDDRRILDNMRAAGHVLTNVPSDLLYGTPFGSDLQRVRRYELIAALLVSSGFPIQLLDGEQWRGSQFAPSAEFFRCRDNERLNEQFISLWARRLLCFYGEITDVRVEGQELRDKFARGNEGMTTERLLRRQLGTDDFDGLDGFDLV